LEPDQIQSSKYYFTSFTESTASESTVAHSLESTFTAVESTAGAVASPVPL
jgi:hypothetical protein